MSKEYTALGLMSGTSGDGVDASIIISDGINGYKVIEDKYFEYDKEIYKNIHNLKERINNKNNLNDFSDELNVSTKDIQALLLGGHGDTMVPLPRYTTVAGIPVTELIKEKKLFDIIERTKFGGGELVKLMGTSAWYAPGAAAAQMVEAIIKNQRRIFPVCVKLEGEYNIDDCYLGVPVILGQNGIEKVIELDLNSDEVKLLEESREHVKEVMGILENLK